MADRKQQALDYHAFPRPGKIAVVPTKPSNSQLDLSLAYSPGVAHACMEIHRDPSLASRYTSRANLVAVVSNGSAVLGLGDIGPKAGKPVMEGKGVLFKRFADIDVFDLEVDTADPQEIIRTVQLLEPTFGGVNLEDIKAPECFLIEETLRETMNIPVFHDDQHGTAIISAAALLNAVELQGKQMDAVRVVVNGAGAAAVSCANLYLRLGVLPRNLIMLDSKGVIFEGRTERMNAYKERFANPTDRRTLAEAVEGADVFVGLSVKDVLSQEMLRSMAAKPIVFALANPDPEITWERAMEARDDVIMATGRSDYPNQVNNVLGFPSIFRGALDAEATGINEEMKMAAVRALAELAREPVPDSVRRIYGADELDFGPLAIIPKPFDPRVLQTVAHAVAMTAVETGVAQKQLDPDEYRDALARRLDPSQEVVQFMIQKAQTDVRRIVFPEGDEPKILQAAQTLREESIAHPVLLGREEDVLAAAEKARVPTDGWEIIDPQDFGRFSDYADEYFRLRRRRGVTRREADRLVRRRTTFGSLMVRLGDADGMVDGITRDYPETIRPALEVIDRRAGIQRVSGMYIVILNRKIYFLADATVNIEPTAEDLAEITRLAALRARRLDIEPRAALLSFSNFGSSRHPLADKVRRATELVKAAEPDLIVDGEMQADTALDSGLLERFFSFSTLQEEANVLVFPNLEAANIAYKLLQKLAGAQTIGPVLMGLNRPVSVLQKGADVNEVVQMAVVAAVDAQENMGAE